MGRSKIIIRSLYEYIFTHNMEEQDKIRLGRKVTWVGFWSNVGLSVLKVIAGFIGRSSAMVADGVHSASDLITDVAVLLVIGPSRKNADKEHAYGHGKIETLVTFIIALILGLVGIGILIDGVKRAAGCLEGDVVPRPGLVALLMAVVSIVVKEWLFRYTRSAARRISSSSMEANAWHHRSDAFSSITTLVGIAGAMFLGERWRILDPAAAILVSFLIITMAYKMGKQVVNELLETSLPETETSRMRQIISETPGIMSFHRFRSRRNGASRIVDLHIKLDPNLTIVQAHDIASEMERRLRKEFDPITVYVHMEPYITPSVDDKT